MCRCQFQDSCFGCHHTTNRRQFVRGSAAAAAAIALGTTIGRGNEPQPGRPRVALVFLSKQGSSWPWPEFLGAVLIDGHRAQADAVRDFITAQSGKG